MTHHPFGLVGLHHHQSVGIVALVDVADVDVLHRSDAQPCENKCHSGYFDKEQCAFPSRVVAGEASEYACYGDSREYGHRNHDAYRGYHCNHCNYDPCPACAEQVVERDAYFAFEGLACDE